MTTPSPYSEYFKLVNELEANPYSKEHPERAILMSVAECVLNYPLFLENYPKCTQLHHGDNEYDWSVTNTMINALGTQPIRVVCIC